MYHFMGYNKDRDTYDELATFDNVRMADAHIDMYQAMLCKDELKDETGEPYDWIEVWDGEDDNGVNDLIISRMEEKVFYKDLLMEQQEQM